MKKNLLYFSDSSFFSGSQNMIINFLDSPVLKNDYNVSFAYVYSELYEKGLHDRLIGEEITLFPISLVDKRVFKSGNKSLFYKIYMAALILVNKYYSLIMNTYLLYKFLSHKNFEIVHINNGGFPGGTPCNAMVFASKLHKITKIVYVVNNTPEGYRRFMRWFDYYIDKIIIGSVSKFVTGSDYSMTILKKTLNLPEHKVAQIFNGISPRKVKLNKVQFLKEYNIPFDSFIVSAVGNLEQRKGHIYLLQALLELLQADLNTNVVVVLASGKINPEEAKLRKYIEENNLGKYVFILPYSISVYDLYNSTNIVVMPSIGSEDLPNVISEAMSMGKLVIGSDIAGISEQIIHNKTGFVVEPRNAKTLYLAMSNIIANPIILKNFGKASIARFNAYFTVEKSLVKYLSLYKKIK